MRCALSAALVLHGLIHVLGSMAAFRLAEVPLPNLAPAWLPAAWTKVVGLLWLLAATSFITSATTLATGWLSWWIPGSIALVISQLLIALAWSDAKAGSIVNLLFVLPLAVGAAHSAFAHGTERAVAELLSPPIGAASVVQASELSRLPPPVARWLASAGVVGRERPRSAWLRQSAGLRTSPEAGWMPCEAEQHFRIDRPGFVWSVRAHMWGVLPIDGRDTYLAGRGRMLIEPLSLVRAVDAQGAQIDQGTLLRFLGELVWFPSAALEPFFHWQAVDDRTARAEMSYAGTSAIATFEFAEDGRVLRVRAERFMSVGAGAELRPWLIPFRAWKRLDGVLIPVEGGVIWELESGAFDYYRWTITALTYGAGGARPRDEAGSESLALQRQAPLEQKPLH